MHHGVVERSIAVIQKDLAVVITVGVQDASLKYENV